MAVLRIDTEPFEADPSADLRYEIQAEVTDQSRRVITGSGQVKVTHKPFYLHVANTKFDGDRTAVVTEHDVSNALLNLERSPHRYVQHK